jgi:hypothetical protein
MLTVAAPSTSKSPDLFFVAAAAVFLALIFAAFAPTFFLRAYFGTRDYTGDGRLPPHLLIHGLVLTAWYVLFFAQTVLVATRRSDIHRSVGAFGAVMALAVVASGTYTVVRAIPRLNAAGAPIEAEVLVAGGDLAALTIFSVLVVLAILYRGQPQTHRRLMFLASVNIIGPAFSEARPVGRALDAFLHGVPGFLVFLLAAFAALIVHDWIVLGRVHRTTMWAVCANVVVLVVSLPVVFWTGPALIRFLSTA